MKHNSVSHLELKSRTFQLLFIGLISRLAIWMSGVVAAFCVDPYDSSGQIAYRLLYTNKSSTKLDVLTRKLIAPFANWDGIYFLRISEYGYEFEQYHAFFPLYPLCIHVFKEGSRNILPKVCCETFNYIECCFSSLGLALLFGTVLTHETLTLLSAFLLSNTFFLIATLAFYRYVRQETQQHLSSLIRAF
jgi:phosphoglycerol transferase MdoB-like AlkP superfamily enzyme